MTRESKLIVFVAVLASLLEIVDTSIVNVAIPTMMGNLGATLEDISMVITGYAIANAVVLPLSAWLGERIGRRKYFLGCIMAFTIISVACGLAPNLTTLIVFRIFQGFVGGALLPTSQTLIYEQFPPEKAGMAGAIFGMSVMIGPALGPVLGGYLTDTYGWRSIFNINLPVGILALIIGSMVIFNRPGSEHHDKSSFDGMGLALLCIGIGSLQFILERGEADDWFDSHLIMILFILAVVCLPAFVIWELKVKNPIIDVRLFKQPIVTYGTILMGCLGFFLYGLVFILPTFVAIVLGYDATQTGELFIPGSILTAFVMPFVGRAMQAGVNSKLLIAIGLVSIELCVLVLTTFTTSTGNGDILFALYIRGFAMAFLFVPINSSILSQFTGTDLGQVSGLLNLFRQIGGSIGIAMISTLLTTKSAQNYIDLVSHVTLFRPAVASQFYATVAGMHTKAVSQVGLGDSYHGALMAMYYKVQHQVFMMSFLQLMWTLMSIFAISFVPLYLLKLTKKVTVVSESH
jgi:DHA2 family multidrug resistance protein